MSEMKVFHMVFEGQKTFTTIATSLKEMCAKAIPFMEKNSVSTTDIVSVSEHEFDMVSTTIH